MGQIITPGSGGSGLTQAISADVIAYYRFEEMADLAIALDSAMNFNAVVPAMRAAGKIGNGLLCVKDGSNFDANMLLDEIPSSYQVTVEMWLKLTEAIKKGEHGTFTIFSKQWASGMKWYCYLISRLESVALRVCLSYSNADVSAAVVLFAGAVGGSFVANGIYSKASAVKYIQAIDPTWTIEYDGATKWQVKKRDTEGVQVTHFERTSAALAGSYTATVYGEGTTVTATALIARQDEYEIDCGELAAGPWHKLYLPLKLRDDYLSQFGIYFDDLYAGGNTAYMIDLPLNTDISPDLLGGDAANVKIATNDATIPYLVDGYPFPSSHRYGLPAIIDEVIISRILLKPITGAGGERPKLFLSSEGLGSAEADPVKTDYDVNEAVELTATPGGGVFSGWLVNGVDMGDDNPYTLIMTPGDKTVIAVFDGKVATPTASPAGGDYSIEQSVVLSCLTSGAAIYYTTNGTTPTSGSTLYTTPISIAAGMTLKAIGIKGGEVNSDIMTEVYTFTLPAPAFNPDGGGGPIDVTMTCAMIGAAIHYTTDESEPDIGDTLYTVPVAVTTGMTLKAKAFKTNCTTSATKTAVYIIADWVRKTDFPGVARYKPVAFSIGTKGYMGTGASSSAFTPTVQYKDFWEYDQATNAWTQKADFGGTVRSAAIGFSIGSKGYLGSGITVPTSPNQEVYDFWEYDPATNIWTQKTDCPGSGGASRRYEHFCFSDGVSYGYFGNSYYKAFYRYNPGPDTWTTLANFPGVAREQPTSVWIGGKGYVGLGLSMDGSTDFKDWWEYDPAGGWGRKADFLCGPVTPYYGSTVFASALACYFLGGFHLGGNTGNHFYKYTVLTDTWVELDYVPPYYGAPISSNYGKGFTINGKGYAYMPAGWYFDGSWHTGSNQFWEYTAL